MNADLYAVVVAEINRLERLYGGDRKDGRHAALKAALELHSDYKGDCAACDLPMPCPTIGAIAGQLRIEVRDEV